LWGGVLGRGCLSWNLDLLVAMGGGPFRWRPAAGSCVPETAPHRSAGRPGEGGAARNPEGTECDRGWPFFGRIRLIALAGAVAGFGERVRKARRSAHGGGRICFPRLGNWSKIAAIPLSPKCPNRRARGAAFRVSPGDKPVDLAEPRNSPGADFGQVAPGHHGAVFLVSCEFRCGTVTQADRGAGLGPPVRFLSFGAAEAEAVITCRRFGSKLVSARCRSALKEALNRVPSSAKPGSWVELVRPKRRVRTGGGRSEPVRSRRGGTGPGEDEDGGSPTGRGNGDGAAP